ncbi:MAG: endonuclease/exonuclease/phosphatase family protein, partial [Desulfuromonadales bacterium]|nr:endonuclease/exonuclease/phosphatase family protein [Desulfuromonadales bacterium]
MTYCITVLSWKVLWAFGLAALIGLTLHWWSGDHLFPGRYTGYLMPWFLVILLPGVVYALLLRQWSLSVVLSVSLGIILYTYAPLLLPRPNVADASPAVLKVMSFNVWSRNSSPERIAAALVEHGPDILLLQEIIPPHFSDLSRALDELSRLNGDTWSKVYNPDLLQATVSRYPLAHQWSKRDKGKVQVVRAETPWGPVMVFNIHPTWGNWTRRDRQLSNLLREDILPCEFPVILGGDFNSPEQSEIFKLLAGHLHNAHTEAGQGFGFTFPRALQIQNRLIPFFPLVRIDHIFFSSHFTALHAGTAEKAYGSDHL